jgi:uncharacterized membrane protein
LRIKIPNVLLIINALVILLILAITIIPSSFVRIVLGLPFLLYFPGFVLVTALFQKERMDTIERVALGFGMSIAVVPLIGLALNYTSWGIKLESVLYSISAFILVMSVVAMIKNGLFTGKHLFNEVTLRLPGWGVSKLERYLTIILAVSILGAIGMLVYVIAFPKIGEKFTEYYILGLNGKAQDYPAEFVMDNGQVTHLRYGTGDMEIAGKWGKVTLGIVNHEQRKTTYSSTVTIDGQQVSVQSGGEIAAQLGPIELLEGEKWEQDIGISPQHIGNSQKVEFLLFKDGDSEPYYILHLWIDVR